MNYILFDDQTWDRLLPLTYTRPVSGLRVGILTIKEKWDKYLKTHCSCLSKEYLAQKYPIHFEDDNILINSCILPSAEIISEISGLNINDSLWQDNMLCAVRLSKKDAEQFSVAEFNAIKKEQLISQCEYISQPWDIFAKNGEAIENDFKILTKGRKSQPLSKTNTVLGNGDIFIERGAEVECSILNTKSGSIYIGKNAEVMEGSVIRGPFALGDGATIKMASKIYGPTTVGPHCKAGGELNNVVMIGYSNKGHDGFLGNAVLGEWCNLGADTNNSNLKNNYTIVKMWSYPKGQFVDSGLQFCGLIMGDHSKCGINTMFNTGTVVGVGANIFGDGFPRNFIPDFSWGGAKGFTETKLDKAHEIAERVMARRNIIYDEKEQKIMERVFELTAKYRDSYRSQK